MENRTLLYWYTLFYLMNLMRLKMSVISLLITCLYYHHCLETTAFYIVIKAQKRSRTIFSDPECHVIWRYLQ